MTIDANKAAHVVVEKVRATTEQAGDIRALRPAGE